MYIDWLTVAKNLCNCILNSRALPATISQLWGILVLFKRVAVQPYSYVALWRRISVAR